MSNTLKTDQLNSIEEALAAISYRISSPEFARRARQMAEDGEKLKYAITVKKGNQQGFVVAFNYVIDNPTQPLATFLRLS